MFTAILVVIILMVLGYIAMYIGSTIYIIVNSKKYNVPYTALWVVVNLLCMPVGLIGYIIDRRGKEIV